MTCSYFSLPVIHELEKQLSLYNLKIIVKCQTPELEKPLSLTYPMEWSKMLSFGPDLWT